MFIYTAGDVLVAAIISIVVVGYLSLLALVCIDKIIKFMKKRWPTK